MVDMKEPILVESDHVEFNEVTHASDMVSSELSTIEDPHFLVP